MDKFIIGPSFVSDIILWMLVNATGEAPQKVALSNDCFKPPLQPFLAELVMHIMCLPWSTVLWLLFLSVRIKGYLFSTPHRAVKWHSILDPIFQQLSNNGAFIAPPIRFLFLKRFMNRFSKAEIFPFVYRPRPQILGVFNPSVRPSHSIHLQIVNLFDIPYSRVWMSISSLQRSSNM